MTEFIFTLILFSEQLSFVYLWASLSLLLCVMAWAMLLQPMKYWCRFTITDTHWKCCLFLAFVFPFCYMLWIPAYELNIHLYMQGLIITQLTFMLVMIYLAGVIIQLAMFILHWYSLYRLKRQTTRCTNQHALEAFKAVSDRLAIKQSVDLRLSNATYTPITFGAINPTIVLPQALIEQLSTEQLKLLLAHELFHIKNRDYLYSLMFYWIKCFLWFMPFQHRVQREIMRIRELNCDQQVLATFNKRKTYASLLVLLAEFILLNKQKIPANEYSVAFFKDRKHLDERFNYIMEYSVQSAPPSKTPWLCYVLYGSLFLVVINVKVTFSQINPSQDPVPVQPLEHITIHHELDDKQPPRAQSTIESTMPFSSQAQLYQNTLWTLSNNDELHSFQLSEDRQSITEIENYNLTNLFEDTFNVSLSENIYFTITLQWRSYLLICARHPHGPPLPGAPVNISEPLTGGLHFFDISNPEELRYVKHIPLIGAGGIQIHGEVLYARVTPNTSHFPLIDHFAAFDLSNPEAPQELWRTPTPNNQFIQSTSLSPDDPNILYAAGDELLIYDISQSPAELLSRWQINQTRSSLRFVETHRGNLVLTSSENIGLGGNFDSRKHVQLVELTDPITPQTVHHYEIPNAGTVISSFLLGDYLLTNYSSDGGLSMLVTSLSGENNLQPLHRFHFENINGPVIIDDQHLHAGFPTHSIFTIESLLPFTNIQNWSVQDNLNQEGE